MNKLLLGFFSLLGTQPLLGAVVVFIPPAPLFTTEEITSSSFPIDLDGNGTDDFQFGGSVIRGTVFRTERANRMVAIPATPPDLGGSAIPILPGVEIGSILPSGVAWLSSSVDGFSEPDVLPGTFSLLTLCVSTGCTGLFYDPSGLRALLGVEFEAEDGLHYGYFDLDFGLGGLSAEIRGWAYETEPNTPITTAFVPEPSASLLLSLGGLLVTRRRRPRAADFSPESLSDCGRRNAAAVV
jgi:hypothetical protein